MSVGYGHSELFYWITWVVSWLSTIVSTVALVMIAVNVARIRDKLGVALHMLNELVGRKQ